MILYTKLLMAEIRLGMCVVSGILLKTMFPVVISNPHKRNFGSPNGPTHLYYKRKKIHILLLRN